MGRSGLVCVLWLVASCGSVSSKMPDAGGGTAHWPAGWQYCKEITVNGAFPDDYSHVLQLTGTELPSTHVNADLSDLRFYLGACGSDDDTQTPLAMWIESASAGAGTVWTRTPVAANATLIAMYYGNSAAPSISSGDQTFPLFDDFDGSALDTAKWDTARSAMSSLNCVTDTVAVANGKLTMEELATNGYPETCVRDVVGKTTFQPTSSYDIRMDLKGLQYPNWGGLGASAGGYRAAASGFLDGANWPNRTNSGYIEASESGYYMASYSNNTSTSSGDKSATANPVITNDVSLRWSPSTFRWLSNGTMVAQNTSNVPTVGLFAQLEVANWSPTNPTGKLVLDRITVMRSVSPGPTYVFAAEKTP